MKKIALINVGFGNIGSVINSLNRIDHLSHTVSNGEELINFNPTHIIMPGVGAVGEAMQKLEHKNFIKTLNFFINKKKVLFCGICVGMQVISDFSLEFGKKNCLGWIPGKVLPLKSNGLSLPHMGWNTILKKKYHSNILEGLYNKDMYFCHTYSLQCEEKYIIAKTHYGNDFISAVNKNNIYGIQCHPEKSLNLGDLFFKNFLELGEVNL